MSSSASTYKNTYDRHNAIATGIIVVALIVSIIAFIIWGLPALQRRDARAARNDEQRLVAIHQNGFPGVTQSDLIGAWNSPGMVFDYEVGTRCIKPIYVRKYEGVYRTYVWLRSDRGTMIFVTYEDLKTLPQTEACFGSG